MCDQFSSYTKCLNDCVIPINNLYSNIGLYNDVYNIYINVKSDYMECVMAIFYMW